MIEDKLEEYQQMTVHELTQKKLHCSYCTANILSPLEELFEAIHNCTNCQVDLWCNGQWNGIAHNIMKELINSYGEERMLLEYEKYQFSKL